MIKKLLSVLTIVAMLVIISGCEQNEMKVKRHSETTKTEQHTVVE